MKPYKMPADGDAAASNNIPLEDEGYDWDWLKDDTNIIREPWEEEQDEGVIIQGAPPIIQPAHTDTPPDDNGGIFSSFRDMFRSPAQSQTSNISAPIFSLPPWREEERRHVTPASAGTPTYAPRPKRNNRQLPSKFNDYIMGKLGMRNKNPPKDPTNK